MAIKRILPPTDSAFAQTARLPRLPLKGGVIFLSRRSVTYDKSSVPAFSTALTRGVGGLPFKAGRRERVVCGGKGRHPSKGCFQGLLKNPRVWELLRHIPRGAGRVGVPACFDEARNRGCPLFPFPARGLKLITRSGTVCSITREATNGQPPFPLFFLFLRPPEAPER